MGLAGEAKIIYKSEENQQSDHYTAHRLYTHKHWTHLVNEYWCYVKPDQKILKREQEAV